MKIAFSIKIFTRNLILYLYNGLINKLPFHRIRLFFYRFVIRVGSKSSILMNVTIRGFNITIGSHSVINQDCLLDGREGQLTIGNNVDIAPYVKIWTVEHDPNSPDYEGRPGDVIIEDHVWVASSAIILPGIIIREGAVVAAGSVVTRNVEPYIIVGGSPARQIGERKRNIRYRHYWRPWFE